MYSTQFFDSLLRFTLTLSLAGMTLLAVVPMVEAEEVCTENAGPTDALGLFKPGKPLALEAGFSDPPPISRIWCWWQCHGSAFTKEELTHQLEQFAKQGFGGVKVPMEMTSLQSIFVVFWEKPTQRVSTAASRQGVPGIIQTLSGPWDITFPADSGAPRQISLEELQPLQMHSEPGVRGFSGVATCTNRFSCDLSRIDPSDQVTLDLGRVCDLCQVTLNGKDLGIRWFTPYCYDITGVLKDGENRLSVRVANSWHNRIVSDSKLASKDRVTRIADPSVYESPFIKNRPLSPSGLIGPVKLRVGE